jgi:hypothetical protein
MSPDPAGQGMFMVRYGTGFVSDDHDGRFPESQPEPVQAGVQRTRSAANTGKRPTPIPNARTGAVAPRIACGGFAGGLRSRCGGFAGAATTEGPRTRAKRLTSIPHVSGVFARVCWTSQNTNQSGRTVRVGFPMRFSGRLRSQLRSSYRAYAGLLGPLRPGVCHRERPYGELSTAPRGR